MCELLGLSFNTPISPTFSFKGLMTRSYHHCNGWGLGCYPGGSKSAQVFKEEVSGATSVLAKFLAEFSDLRSKTFIGHIRKASQGVESYDNTHPFNRFYCHREWLFAHNGTLRNSTPLHSKFLPLGETDSEKAFCYLLGKMSESSLRPTRHGNYVGFDRITITGIYQIIQEINRIGDGPFNTVFTDGTYLFCYRDIRGRRNLYYLERKAPFEKAAMRDTELEIDLRISKGVEETGVIVASDKLTNDSWISFNPGELKVWKDGALIETRSTLGGYGAYQVQPDQNRLWNRIVSLLNERKPGWRQSVEDFGQVKAVKDRRAGKSWSDNEIFEGLLKSVLSNNTDWARIETVLQELSDVFNGFSLVSYANLPKEDVKNRIVPWFEQRKAGSSTLQRSLEYLIKATQILLSWSVKHGSAENYFLGLMEQVQGDPKRAAIKMGTYTSQYKLPAFGVALAAEALRNIGFDLAKPDRHILRSVGSFGLMEFSRWTDRSSTKPPNPTTSELLESMTIIENLAMSAGEYTSLVDNAIWMTCARSGLHLSNDALKELAG